MSPTNEWMNEVWHAHTPGLQLNHQVDERHVVTQMNPKLKTQGERSHLT